MTAFARGEGIWSRLGIVARASQLDRMIELVDELYPTFRWFLFDGSKRYAAPVTIFGTQRAALYLGQLYLVLTSVEHVRALSRHFDGVIRDAEHQRRWHSGTAHPTARARRALSEAVRLRTRRLSGREHVDERRLRHDPRP